MPKALLHSPLHIKAFNRIEKKRRGKECKEESLYRHYRGIYMTLDDMKGLTPQQQEREFNRIDKVRHLGKSTNYASQYGAGGPTIARSAGIPEKEGIKLHSAYWSKNWAVKAIAEDCVVKVCKGQKWLLNPISGIWHFLKADKDRFSTLCQGTGTFLFDMWLKNILEERKQMTGQMHDECIMEITKGNRDKMTKILKDAVHKVNEEYQLNRDLDCDISFGGSYSEIH